MPVRNTSFYFGRLAKFVRTHDELFTLSELASQLTLYDLPTEAWRTDPARRFEVYVEAQVWSHEAVRSITEFV